MFNAVVLVFLTCIVCVEPKLEAHIDKRQIHESVGSFNNTNGLNKDVHEVDGGKMYKSLLTVKRREQLSAVKSIMELGNSKKQRELLQDLLKAIEKVMRNAYKQIEKENFRPNSSFPSEDGLREALANIVENTAFLSEIILRFPAYIEKKYVTNPEWKGLVTWAYNFSINTNLYDDAGLKVLSLAAQQLNIIPREETFHNPYDMKNIKDGMQREALRKIEKAKLMKIEEKKLDRKRKKITKPSLTRADL